MKNTTHILLRTVAGFEARELKLRNGFSILPQEDADTDYQQGGLIDLTAISGRYLRKDIPLGQYISEMKSLLPTQYHDLILGYYFSGRYVAKPAELLQGSVGDEAEFSVVVQTLVLSGKIEDPGVQQIINRAVPRLIRRFVGKRTPPRVQEFDTLYKLFANVGGPSESKIETLADFNQYIGGVKGKLVPILGPDIFTVFQELFDPDRLISQADTIRMFAIAMGWGCADLLTRLLLIRATRCTPGDQTALDKALSDPSIRSRLSARTLKLCASWRSLEEVSGKIDNGRMSRAIVKICKIRAVTAEGLAEELIDELVALYSIDPSLMEWIDWESVYRKIRSSPRLVGVRSCIIHLLMGEDHVRGKFPVVAFAEGDGAFESALRAAVSDLPEKTLDRLCSELNLLSGNAKDLMVNAIVAPEASAMLAILLQYQPSWAKQLKTGGELAYDIRASGLRSDLATALAKHSLIDQARGQLIVDEEQARLRVAYLQKRQLDGLVHVDWERTERFLDREFSGPLALVRQMLDEPSLENRTSYLSDVVEGLSERAARLVLIDGPDNLKTTISDALRHGQLRNRFLVAFDRAASNLARMQGYDGLDFRGLIELFEGRGSDWLVRSRAALVDQVQKFNEDSLSVWEASKLRRRVQIAATNSFMDSLKDRSKFGETFASKVKVELQEFLRVARLQLELSVGRYLATVEKATRSFPASKRKVEKAAMVLDKDQFVLALREQILEARRDALSWIALTDNRQDPEPFDFNDLVQLCLINHRPDSARALYVTPIVSEWRPDRGVVIIRKPPQIRGRYFLFLETVVKNILANAFAHSGLALNTRIQIELSVRKNRLLIHSKNNLSRVKYKTLQHDILRVQNELNDKNLAAAANDSGSGLHKVRWAFQRSLGSLPSVTLLLSPRAASIAIQIDAQHDQGQIFV